MDSHPGLRQDDVVNHFASRVDGALMFTQPTLSRRLKEWPTLVNSNPNALSMKRYDAKKWQPALDAVMAAENDDDAALDAIIKLRYTSNPVPSIPPPAKAAAQSQIETDLMESVAELKNRNRIFGPMPALDDLLDPVEEREVGDSPYLFEGGDEEIAAQVCREQAEDAIEIDSDDEEEPEPDLTAAEMLQHARLLEIACLSSGVESSFEVLQVLRRFRVQLTKMQMVNAKQVTLENLWGSHMSHEVTERDGYTIV
jgi:hypothetical protein